jgi:hypothetical protein
LFDEEEPELGQNLKLPPWLEQHRAQIENHLTPLVMPSWQDPEVGA